MDDPALASNPSPVKESDRIVSIDVLRGVAVLGILVMNIQAFAMVSSAYMNPTSFGDFTGGNYWVWMICHVLAEMKMMTIFSMLFGAGVLLMTQRAESAAGRSAGVHYRRMFWLILFGLAHAHLLWFGDILYGYGMSGLLLFLFRKRSPGTLIICGLVFTAIGSLSMVGMAASYPDHWPPEQIQEMKNDWNSNQNLIQKEIEIYRGGWLDQMEHRVPTAFEFETIMFLVFMLWRGMGMMLIGMALYRWNVFHATRSTGFYLGLILMAILIGMPLVLYGAHYNVSHNWSFEHSFFYGMHFNYWGSLFVALGWIGLIMLMCKSQFWDWLTGILAPVGRMALSCYLLQTIICTTIFYGHGFGYFGMLNRLQMFGVVLAVWAFLILFAPIWLHYFRFGPFEWLWRSLTYWKLQPMRRMETIR